MSAPATPPGSPSRPKDKDSPSKSFRSRMGGVVRRTSTAMTFNTPLRRKSSASSAKLRGETDGHQKATSMDSSRDSGKGSSREGSIRSVQLDTSTHALAPPPPAVDDAPQQQEQQQEPQPEVHAAPSPIAESPMREAASLREEEQEQQQKQQKPELPIPHHLKPSPLAHEVIPSPITPILDTQLPTEDGGSIKAGPVIFDEPDTMSMAGSIATVPKTDEPAPKYSQQEEPAKTEPQNTPAQDGAHPESSKAAEEPPVQPEEAKQEAAIAGNRPVDLAVAQPPSEPESTPAATTTPPSEPPATTSAEEDEEQTFHIMPVPSSNPGTQPEYDSPFIAPRGEGKPPSDRAFFISTPPMEKTEGQAPERVQHVTFEDGLRDADDDGEVQGTNEAARESWRGQPANAGPSTAVGYTDPFADPEPEQEHQLRMPEVVQMPAAFPPNGNVIQQHMPEAIRPIPIPIQHYDNDESRPLLEGNGHHSNYDSQTQAVSLATARLQRFGWLEFALPDGAVYFVHPVWKVTSDADLRQEDVLNTINNMFDGAQGTMDDESETWIIPLTSRSGKKIPKVERYIVDHGKRSVVGSPDGKGQKHGKQARGEDGLDMEYRYWCFLETHPAHAALPPGARGDAMDILTWAWTDRLLPSERTVRPAFSLDECRELMGALRPYNGEGGLQAVVHTRIIARIMIRIAQWRQTYFRPSKPLPQGVTTSSVNPNLPIRIPRRKRTIRKVLTSLFVSTLCLGIPYALFAKTARYNGRYFDEETGSFATGEGMVSSVIVGASTSLIAALVLSTAVTFLSLAGLDDRARVAGLVGAACAAGAMVSGIGSLFYVRGQEAYGHGGAGNGARLGYGQPALGEGITVMSRKELVLSLPAVLLSYSIIALVTALVFYAFRGQEGVDKTQVARWVILGVVGALVGYGVGVWLLVRR